MSSSSHDVPWRASLPPPLAGTPRRRPASLRSSTLKSPSPSKPTPCAAKSKSTLPGKFARSVAGFDADGAPGNMPEIVGGPERLRLRSWHAPRRPRRRLHRDRRDPSPAGRGPPPASAPGPGPRWARRAPVVRPEAAQSILALRAAHGDIVAHQRPAESRASRRADRAAARLCTIAIVPEPSSTAPEGCFSSMRSAVTTRAAYDPSNKESNAPAPGPRGSEARVR